MEIDREVDSHTPPPRTWPSGPAGAGCIEHSSRPVPPKASFLRQSFLRRLSDVQMAPPMERDTPQARGRGSSWRILCRAWLWVLCERQERACYVAACVWGLQSGPACIGTETVTLAAGRERGHDRERGSWPCRTLEPTRTNPVTNPTIPTAPPPPDGSRPPFERARYPDTDATAIITNTIATIATSRTSAAFERPRSFGACRSGCASTPSGCTER